MKLPNATSQPPWQDSFAATMCSRCDAANCEWSRAHSAAHCVLCASASWSNENKSIWIRYQPDKVSGICIWLFVSGPNDTFSPTQFGKSGVAIIIISPTSLSASSIKRCKKQLVHNMFAINNCHNWKYMYSKYNNCKRPPSSTLTSSPSAAASSSPWLYSYTHPYRRGNYWIAAIICRRSAAKTRLVRFPDPLPFHSNDATWLSNRTCNFVATRLERARSKRIKRDVLSQRTIYNTISEIGWAFWDWQCRSKT